MWRGVLRAMQGRERRRRRQSKPRFSRYGEGAGSGCPLRPDLAPSRSGCRAGRDWLVREVKAEMEAVFWLDAGLRSYGTFGEGGVKGEGWAVAGAGQALEGETGRE